MASRTPTLTLSILPSHNRFFLVAPPYTKLHTSLVENSCWHVIMYWLCPQFLKKMEQNSGYTRHVLTCYVCPVFSEFSRTCLNQTLLNKYVIQKLMCILFIYLSLSQLWTQCINKHVHLWHKYVHLNIGGLLTQFFRYLLTQSDGRSKLKTDTNYRLPQNFITTKRYYTQEPRKTKTIHYLLFTPTNPSPTTIWNLFEFLLDLHEKSLLEPLLS